MDKYLPLYKPNQIDIGNGNVILVTGWTVKKTLKNKLNINDYAAIGNLYSAARGINFLIRNLLANPNSRHIVILAATKEDHNAGSCRCLADFFQFGVMDGIDQQKKVKWVVKSNIAGYLDKEIPLESIERLRERMQWRLVYSQDDAIAAVREFAEESRNEEIRVLEKEIYPQPSVHTNIFPGNLYGHRVEGKTVAQTWVKILHRIRSTGTIRPTGYDGQWQELINVMAIVTDEPTDFFIPEYLPFSADFIQEYLPQILQDAPYVEGIKYTYGQRLRSWFGGVDQVQQVVDKLIGEIDSASAVLSLWDVDDHIKGGSPCLNHIWVRVVDNELSLTATFRSNDIFSAWPANAMGLRALQVHIRDEIASNSAYKLRLGPLITISQSAHIYDDCWDNVDGLLSQEYFSYTTETIHSDAVGNFLIEIDKSCIKVTQLAPTGEALQIYQGKNPLRLIREIVGVNPAIEPSHIGYLGIELQKAKESLLNNRSYIQDR